MVFDALRVRYYIKNILCKDYFVRRIRIFPPVVFIDGYYLFATKKLFNYFHHNVLLGMNNSLDAAINPAGALVKPRINVGPNKGREPCGRRVVVTGRPDLLLFSWKITHAFHAMHARRPQETRWKSNGKLVLWRWHW